MKGRKCPKVWEDLRDFKLLWQVCALTVMSLLFLPAGVNETAEYNSGK